MSEQAAARPTIDEIKRAKMKLLRKKRARRRRRGLLVVLLIALAAGAYVFAQYFTIVTMQGNGMRRTLENGSVVLCRRGAEATYQSLVLLDLDDSMQIRRVIALPGDRVFIDASGHVRVNGALLDEPYAVGAERLYGDQKYPLRVPENSLFVMGDHRGTALDSRFTAFGTVSMDAVVGQAKLIIWPVFRIGWVE